MTRFTAVGLVLIVAAGLLDFFANWLAAHYLITVWTFIIPAGTFAFALSFTIYDALRRIHGIPWTVAAIVLGFALSVLYTVSFGSSTGRIAIAGIIALACSSTADFLTQNYTLRWPIWEYVLSCNLIALAVDTLVFVLIAFAALPTDVRWHIMEGQYLAKIAMTVVSIPLVYATRAYLHPHVTPRLSQA